jgi:hypothetical protein
LGQITQGRGGIGHHDQLRGTDGSVLAADDVSSPVFDGLVNVIMTVNMGPGHGHEDVAGTNLSRIGAHSDPFALRLNQRQKLRKRHAAIPEWSPGADILS